MKRNQALKLAAVAALTVIAAACSNPEVSHNKPYATELPANKEQNVHKADSPQKNYFENIAQNGTAEPVEAEAATDNYANTESSQSTDHADSPKSHDSSTRTKDAVWLSEQPSLLELSIGDSEQQVNERYGDALDSYLLSDGTEQIQVLEYEGFAVGINEKDKVHFVELYARSYKPGLSGLQIGDTLDEALKALGKPDTQTDYLLTYQAEGAFLKLDLDPSLNEVISIKLLVS